MVGMRTEIAVAMSWIKRCPAVKLAVNRTPRAIGRINRLIVSMTISTGISRMGVPSGRRCPSAAVGWFRTPMITVANQNGMASPILSESWVVGVKVYGRSPSILMDSKNTINDIKIRAHLWPPWLSGRRSCWVNRLKKCPCSVTNRLWTQRFDGVG